MTRRIWAAVVAGIAFSAVTLSGQTQTTPQTNRVYREGPGVVLPTLIRSVEPAYTAEAMRRSIQGDVELEAVVLANGAVGDIRVVRSLDKVYGLDEQALKAAKQWLFRPGTMNGQPAPVLVTLILSFRMSPGLPVQMVFASGLEQNDPFVGTAYSLNDPSLAPPRRLGQQGGQGANALVEPGPRTVEIDAVIAPDGTINRMRVSKSADKTAGGADDRALQQVRVLRFQAGLINESPVPVIVRFLVRVDR
jgi:TonB family protein